MNAQPFLARNPLQFRGIPDGLAEMHVEGSECCLIHADNPLSTTEGVYVNPNVRVGYSVEAYEAVNPSSMWPSLGQRFKGIWMARLATVPALLRRAAEELVINKSLRQWQAQESAGGRRDNETAVHCLINEMQVLTENGWKHL